MGNQRREIKDIASKATKHQNWLSEKTGNQSKKEPEDLKALDEIISDVINDSSNIIENQKNDFDNLKEETECERNDFEKLEKENLDLNNSLDKVTDQSQKLRKNFEELMDKYKKIDDENERMKRRLEDEVQKKQIAE